MMNFQHIHLPSIRPLTTAHLAQTMTLLGLTAMELRQKIEDELAKNPALELIEGRYCPNCNRPLANSGPCPECFRRQNESSDEPIIFISPRDDFIIPRSAVPDNENPFDELIAEYQDLSSYVLQQIATEIAPEDRVLAVHILTSLDEDGLLPVPIIEIASYHHVPVSRVEKIIHLIQHADPIGVGSPSPQEALRVQLQVLAENHPVPPMAEKAIETGLDLIGRRQYHELARKLGISVNEIKVISNFISQNLNPFPARAFWGEVHLPPSKLQDAYYHPDIIISLLNQNEDGPLVIEVISPLSGKLQVNPEFRKAISSAPTNKTEQWQNDLEKASLLVKCIQQRNHTIIRMMHEIAARQKEFILKGDTHLLPTTRASVAENLALHESTISRAVSNKTVQLPNRKIIPLAKFFDRSLHIRAELLNIIAQETKPLTDTEIADILKKRGYKVARRTVAKYRSIEGIMPAHLRARFSRQQHKTVPVVIHAI